MDPSLFAFPPARDVRQLHPLVLAYIGDSVYDMYVRQYVISLPNHKMHVLHRRATEFVSAKAQSRALHALLPLLTEEERDVARRGRNAKPGTIPKNADVQEYRHATALESLVGYLFYLKQYDRLRFLLDCAVGAADPQGGQEA